MRSGVEGGKKSKKSINVEFLIARSIHPVSVVDVFDVFEEL